MRGPRHGLPQVPSYARRVNCIPPSCSPPSGIAGTQRRHRDRHALRKRARGYRRAALRRCRGRSRPRSRTRAGARGGALPARGAPRRPAPARRRARSVRCVARARPPQREGAQQSRLRAAAARAPRRSRSGLSARARAPARLRHAVHESRQGAGTDGAQCRRRRDLRHGACIRTRRRPLRTIPRGCRRSCRVRARRTAG